LYEKISNILKLEILFCKTLFLLVNPSIPFVIPVRVTAVMTCPQKTVPEAMIGIEKIGGTTHGNTKTIFT
jgi:hypothetical protein